MTPGAVAVSRAGSRPGRVTFARVLKSEWVKLRSLRSIAWPYAIGTAIWIAIAYQMASGFDTSGPLTAVDGTHFVANVSVFGVLFGQIVAAVLGVIVLSAEYTTGTIYTTLIAVPRRLPVLWAKAVVVFTASFAFGVISGLGSFAVAYVLLTGKGVSVSLIDPTVFLAIVAASFYLGVVSAFALGVGAITRNSAGGIPAALGLTILLPILPGYLPVVSLNAMAPYMLMNAGFATFEMASLAGPSPLATWQQLLVIVGWAVVALAIGAVVLKTRDA